MGCAVAAVACDGGGGGGAGPVWEEEEAESSRSISSWFRVEGVGGGNEGPKDGLESMGAAAGARGP